MNHQHPNGPSTEGSRRKSTWQRSRTPSKCMDGGDVEEGSDRKFSNSIFFSEHCVTCLEHLYGFPTLFFKSIRCVAHIGYLHSACLASSGSSLHCQHLL
ncbi:uncharacterized protein LOC117162308 isoform X2 [Bombus vancouverensis nearcticus]|uniref:uncharacterized protein LOC143302419 isoform X2 n=1 Tax=Bombus vancouverensis nearcticus TaxID=2705178 RepID=UPI00402B0A3A